MIKTILTPIGSWKRKFAALPVYREEQPEVINGVKHTKRTKIWLEHYWEMQITNQRREITTIIQTSDQRFSEFVAEVNGLLNFKYDVAVFSMTDSTMDMARRLFNKGRTPVQVLEAMSNAPIKTICIELVSAYGPINLKYNKGQIEGASSDLNMVVVENALYAWIATAFPVPELSNRTLLQQVRDFSTLGNVGPQTLKACMLAFTAAWESNRIKVTLNDDGVWIDYSGETYRIEVKEYND